MSDWTRGAEQILRALWAEGLSAAQIAKKLGKEPICFKVTRNAVIGKIKRMGLPGRADPTARTKRVTRAAKPEQRLPAPKPDHVINVRRAPRNTRNIRFINRTADQCSMFCEGEEGALGFVCGEVCEPGLNWCAACHAIVAAPMPKMEEAA